MPQLNCHQNPQLRFRKIGAHGALNCVERGKYCAMEKGSAMGKSGMLEFFMEATLYSQSEIEQNKFDQEHDAIRLMH